MDILTSVAAPRHGILDPLNPHSSPLVPLPLCISVYHGLYRECPIAMLAISGPRTLQPASVSWSLLSTWRHLLNRPCHKVLAGPLDFIHELAVGAEETSSQTILFREASDDYPGRTMSSLFHPPSLPCSLFGFFVSFLVRGLAPSGCFVQALDFTQRFILDSVLRLLVALR